MKTKSTTKKQNLFNKLSIRLLNKVRIVIVNKDSFEEKSSFVISALSAIVYFMFAIMIVSLLTFFIISYTSLKTIIPGYPNQTHLQSIKTQNIASLNKLELLEKNLDNKTSYIENIKLILQGYSADEFNSETELKDTLKTENITFYTSKKDSILRLKVKEREKYDIHSYANNNGDNNNLAGILFFCPLKGDITNSIDIEKGHYGVDIIASNNETIKSSLGGFVLYADWSPENGYIILIQHNNNLISVYKHNSSLLKEVGDIVKTGDAIAIIGNSGELSSGPHLHFELWHKGIPLNPEEFMSFN